MKEFLKTHRIAIFFAIVVGVITGVPSVLAPLSIGDAYHGIPFFPLSDEYHYLANIHEILDGHWSAASTFLYEYKNMPTTMYPVNEWLYAIPSFFFGTIAVAVASVFVLPGMLFFLSYLVLFNLLGKNAAANKLAALAGGLFIVLGAEFVNYSYLIGVLKGGIPIENVWTRLVNPIAGALQLMGFLIALWNVWDRGWRYAYIAAGIILASMVGYFFTFGLSLAILAALFIIALTRKEYDIVKKLFLIGAISVALDAAWWYSMVTTLGGEEGRMIAMRSGMFFTHAPVLNKAVLAASILFFLFFLYAWFYVRDRGHVMKWLFAASLLLGSWIAFNQQIITGREVWYPHFVQYTVPLCVIAVIAAAHLAFSRHRFLWNGAMYALCALMIGYGLFSVSSFRENGTLQYFALTQRYAPIFSWLNANAPLDCVVLVNPKDTFWQSEEGFIPAFSNCNTYTVWDRLMSKTSERALHNFLLKMQMRGVAPKDARDYLLADWGNVRGSFYDDWNQAFGKGVDPWVEDRIAELTKEYNVFIKTDIETHIKKYRADYLFSDGPISPALRKMLPDLSLATSTEGLYLYSFAAAPLQGAAQ